MGMTLTQKIIAAHCGQKSVKAGDIVTCQYDKAMATDGTAPLAENEFLEMGAEKVADPSKIVLINDHFQPANSVKAAQLSKQMREFAKSQNIEHYYEVGKGGVCHALMMEERHVGPGDFAIGADSHSVTYGAIGAFSTGIGATDMAAAWALGEFWLKVPEAIKIIFKGRLQKGVTSKDMLLRALKDVGDDGALYKSIEFDGDALDHLTMWQRITLCNMAIEMGGKNGIIPFDKTAEAWLREKRGDSESFETLHADEDAEYTATFEYDISKLEPQVACPSLPSNVKPVTEVAGTKVDQVYFGSCTNGYYDDLKCGADMIRGTKISDSLRMIVVPATHQIYRDTMRDGILQAFADAGAAVMTAGCGACFGGHMGLMADNEVCFSTTNRNYPGRMGHPTSKTYLGSPETAVATAIKGVITDPRELLG